MWSKLIDIIIQLWKEHPRKDLIRQFIELRNYMNKCQSSYEKFIASQDHDGPDYTDNSRFEWLHAVESLQGVILEIDQVLSIYSPDARKALDDYMCHESLQLNACGLIDATAKNFNMDTADVDIDKCNLGLNFKVALDELDKFIRSTFKVEEIHAATTT